MAEKNLQKDKDRKIKYYLQNPEKRLAANRRRNRFSKYGITEQDYNALFAKQNGKCAVCGIHQQEIGKVLHIDHCHKTEKVRGLLCSNCNTAIGLLQNDIENLRCAILYLNKKD